MEKLMQICPLLYLHMSNDQSPCCVVYTWSNKTCCLKQDPKKLRIQKLIIKPTSKGLGRNCVDQKRHIAALTLAFTAEVCLSTWGSGDPLSTDELLRSFHDNLDHEAWRKCWVMGRPNHVGCENWAHLGKWEIVFVDVTKKQHSRHTVLHFVITKYGRKYNILQYSLLLSV